MTNTRSQTAIANGADPVQQKAANDANAVQNGCNICGILDAFHRHMIALSRSGLDGNQLNNHPVALAFVSKLNSLCRMSFEREMAALRAIDQIEQREQVEYEVIPLLTASLKPIPASESDNSNSLERRTL